MRSSRGRSSQRWCTTTTLLVRRTNGPWRRIEAHLSASGVVVTQEHMFLAPLYFGFIIVVVIVVVVVVAFTSPRDPLTYITGLQQNPKPVVSHSRGSESFTINLSGGHSRLNLLNNPKPSIHLNLKVTISHQPNSKKGGGGLSISRPTQPQDDNLPSTGHWKHLPTTRDMGMERKWAESVEIPVFSSPTGRTYRYLPVFFNLRYIS